MSGPRVMETSLRTRNGQADEAAQQIAAERIRHMRLLRAARTIVLQWRPQHDGTHRIPSGARLALLAAIDESWDAMKGVSE